MTRKRQDMQRLRDVMGLAYDATQAKMQVLQRAEAELRAQITHLDQASSDAARNTKDSPALRSNAHLLWQTWATSRRKALNMELAKLQVKKDALRGDLRLAFGRKSVSDQLHADIEKARKPPP